MEKGSTPAQNISLSLLRAIRWVAKATALALALYIFFPPLWDAAFEADLESLHQAPYVAADRAHKLWDGIVAGLRDTAGPGPANAKNERP